MWFCSVLGDVDVGHQARWDAGSGVCGGRVQVDGNMNELNDTPNTADRRAFVRVRAAFDACGLDLLEIVQGGRP